MRDRTNKNLSAVLDLLSSGIGVEFEANFLDDFWVSFRPAHPSEVRAQGVRVGPLRIRTETMEDTEPTALLQLLRRENAIGRIASGETVTIEVRY